MAQLRKLPENFRQFELSGIRKIIGGPGLWATSSLFYNFKRGVGFPSELPPLLSMCKSAMVRAGYQNIINILHLKGSIEREACGFESNAIHPMAGWRDGSAAFVVSDAGIGINWQSMCSFHALDIDSVLERNHFQKRCYEYFAVQDYPFCLRSCLESKFGKWFEDSDCRVYSGMAIDILNVLKGISPCVLFSVVSL